MFICNVNLCPAKDEKDEKAPPPAKVSPKVETVHCESSRGSFFSSIADGIINLIKRNNFFFIFAFLFILTSLRKLGFNWGAGNAMGHRFVESIFGPRTIKTEVVLPERVEVAAVSAIDDNDKYKDYNESCSISYNAFQEVRPTFLMMIVLKFKNHLQNSVIFFLREYCLFMIRSA